MLEFKGKSVCKALTMGKLYFFDADTTPIKRTRVDNTQNESKRFANARAEAHKQLSELYLKAL